MFSKIFFNISKRWTILILTLLLIFSVLIIYFYHEFYRQDKISLEILSGEVTKTKSNQRSMVEQRGTEFLPGDSIEVAKDGAVVLIFHDGSVMTFKNGDSLKYNQFKSTDRNNLFTFTNLKTNEDFEYVTQSFLNNTGAAIIGKEGNDNTDQNNEIKTKVLGANEKKFTDKERESIWKNIAVCMQSPKEGEIFGSTLQRCLENNNLKSLGLPQNHPNTILGFLNSSIR